MDKQALGMAVFMGLYVPLFTGISVTIHRWMEEQPQQANKTIIVRRQFKHQSFDDANLNSVLQLVKTDNFPFSKEILQVKPLSFYKYLPPAYTIDNDLLQNFDLGKFAIVESKMKSQQNQK